MLCCRRRADLSDPVRNIPVGATSRSETCSRCIIRKVPKISDFLGNLGSLLAEDTDKPEAKSGRLDVTGNIRAAIFLRGLWGPSMQYFLHLERRQAHPICSTIYPIVWHTYRTSSNARFQTRRPFCPVLLKALDLTALLRRICLPQGTTRFFDWTLHETH